MNGFGLLGSFAIIGFGWAVVRSLSMRWRRPRRVNAHEPRSLVRVLRDEEELKEAVARAIEFERSVAESAERRIERYARAHVVAPVVRLPISAEQRTDAASSDRAREPIGAEALETA